MCQAAYTGHTFSEVLWHKLAVAVEQCLARLPICQRAWAARHRRDRAGQHRAQLRRLLQEARVEGLARRAVLLRVHQGAAVRDLRKTQMSIARNILVLYR